MKHYLPAGRRGFTLIELLVVIGILAVLLAITLIAINPARQFAAANDTKRSSDVNAILNAVGQYMADNRGNLPAGIPAAATEIGNRVGPPADVDICADLITTYIAALPVDPQIVNAAVSAQPGAPVTTCANAHHTGYTIMQSATDGRITVAATPQGTAPISVTR